MKYNVGDIVVINNGLDKFEVVIVRERILTLKNVNNGLKVYANVKEVSLPKKTPHDRLIELGWVALNETGRTLTYILYSNGSLHAERIELSHEGKSFYTTLRVIDLELAEVLVDYLKELRDE